MSSPGLSNPLLKRGLPTIAAVLIRAAALLSRFLLLFYLASHFPVSALGLYGVVMATVELAVYLMGLEFASFATRELIHGALQDRARMLRDQAVLFLATFVPAAIAAPILAGVGMFGSKETLWIIGIFMVEHAAQEAYRLLVAASRPLLATLMHFIRFGAWVYPLLVLMWLVPDARRIEWVWAGWILGALASLVIPIVVFSDVDWKSLHGVSIDWKWLRRGLGAGAVLFVGFSLTRAAGSLDRMILQLTNGAAAVGEYQFFLAITSVAPWMIEAGVQIHHLPRLVMLYRSRSHQFRKSARVYAESLTVAALICVVGLAAIILPILNLLGSQVYGGKLSIFWCLLAAAFVWCLGQIPQTLLYAMERDRSILLGNMFHLGIVAVATVVLSVLYGGVGTAVAQLLAASVSLAVRWVLVLKGQGQNMLQT